jgi:PAS domain S-box-containing protein
MRAAARLWLVVVPAALLVGGIAIALAATTDHQRQSPAIIVLELLVGWSFIAAGLIARTRRPENRTGLLLIGIGFAWFLNALSFANQSRVWTLGFLLGALWAAFFVHTLLAYPTGRLGTVRDRAVVIAGYVLAVTANLALALFNPDPASCSDCPTNEALVRDDHTAANVAIGIVTVLGAAYLIAVAVALILRWRRTTAVARRLLGPVLLAGGFSVGLLGLAIALGPVSEAVSGVMGGLAALSFLAVPFLLLHGLLRTRLARVGLGRALIALPDRASLTDTQAAVRDALADPAAELLFWDAQRAQYVDIDGNPREPQRPGAGRVVTAIDADGQPLGALLHDEALLDERELLSDAADAARVAISKERAQFALETSERRNRALLEAIPDAMIRIRRDGTVVDWHADERHITFDAPEGFVGMNLFELVRDHRGNLMKEAAARALDRGELQTVEYDLDIRGELHNREGRVVASGEDEVVVVIRDITDRTRALQALETSERRSRALVHAVPDAMLRIRRDGTVLDWHADPRYINFEAPDDFVGANFYELMPRQDEAALILAAAERALESGEVQTVEYDIDLHGDLRNREGRIVVSGDDEVILMIRDITDRKQAQQALETSERRSRALLEGVPDNIYRVARDGHRFLDIRWADPTRLPVPQERFIGGTVHDLGLPGDLADKFIDLAETAFATGRLQSIEYAVEVGGEPLYLEARIVPSGDDEYFVTVRDVTDRKRAQLNLEASERRSRALLAGIPDNIFRVAYEDHRFLDVRMARVTRFLDPEGLVGRTVDDIGFPEAVIERVRAAAELARETGEVQVIEYELEDDLGAMHLESRVVPSGEEYYIVVRDVTDRKDAELALKGQRDFLSAVGDATPALLAVLAADGTMSGEPLNHALRELTGLANADAEGRNFFELVSTQGDAPRSERIVRTAADTGEPQSAETRWRGSRGERLVAWTATPLPDVERGGSLVLLSGVDITERAAQEEELRRSRARIVEAGDAERRRLERNLHDGAQQRLVSLSLSLRLAHARVKSDPEAAGALLSGASTELALALEELRELARGIHPAVLTDRGLGPALESLADRAPLPVELSEVPEERLPAPVEAAAFYVVAEALTNVAKYADASIVRVSIARTNGRAVVEVADDGCGGADPAKGSGLRGLVDRVSALDGTLSVDSPEGGGTRVRAEIPTAQE